MIGPHVRVDEAALVQVAHDLQDALGDLAPLRVAHLFEEGEREGRGGRGGRGGEGGGREGRGGEGGRGGRYECVL